MKTIHYNTPAWQIEYDFMRVWMKLLGHGFCGDMPCMGGVYCEKGRHSAYLS